ncbi:MAG: DoxX family protein [Kiritimatiellae bacterium]|nr:DoxX family protein [Kiritimatiellia bacterium]
MGNESAGKDLGLLLLRVGIGIMFMRFGWGKISNPDGWAGLGGAMKSVYGISAAPAFWGFMAALAEFGGGVALLLGIFVRPFALLMAFTMVTGAAMLIGGGADLIKYGHPVNMAIVFISLLFMGGGNYALGAFIPGLRGHWFR